MSAVSPGPVHPSDAAHHAYLAGTLAPAAAAAIELHAAHCPTCRFAVNEAAMLGHDARVAHNLLVVRAVLDAPRRGVVERSLVRLGAPADIVRMMIATPALRRSWFIAIGLALLFGLSAASPNRPDTTILWFLALAPLIPVVGVALAYGPGVDPSYEMALATPVSGFRLVLIRSLAVLTTSVAITGAIALLMAERHALMIGAWVLPALALCCVCLALMTVVRPGVAAAIVTSIWLVVVVGASGASDQLVLFRGPGQLAFLIVGVAGAVVVAVRRRTFDVALRDAVA